MHLATLSWNFMIIYLQLDIWYLSIFLMFIFFQQWWGPCRFKINLFIGGIAGDALFVCLRRVCDFPGGGVVTGSTIMLATTLHLRQLWLRKHVEDHMSCKDPLNLLSPPLEHINLYRHPCSLLFCFEHLTQCSYLCLDILFFFIIVY